MRLIQGGRPMDKMEFRKAMYKRAERTAYVNALQKAANGHPCPLVLYEMELIEQKNLIFGNGSLFTSKEKDK